MTFHAPPKTQAPMNALPTYSARDLTEGGDLAQIVLDTQTYTCLLYTSPSPRD